MAQNLGQVNYLDMANNDMMGVDNDHDSPFQEPVNL